MTFGVFEPHMHPGNYFWDDQLLPRLLGLRVRRLLLSRHAATGATLGVRQGPRRMRPLNENQVAERDGVRDGVPARLWAARAAHSLAGVLLSAIRLFVGRT